MASHALKLIQKIEDKTMANPLIAVNYPVADRKNTGAKISGGLENAKVLDSTRAQEP